MNKILVPEHIVEKVEENQKKLEPTNPEIEEAYVNTDERVLDPTLLDKSFVERMPQPSGWRMLILPYKGKGVTKGGIHLAKETLDRESLATVVAYVVKMGPLCFSDQNTW